MPKPQQPEQRRQDHEDDEKFRPAPEQVAERAHDAATAGQDRAATDVARSDRTRRDVDRRAWRSTRDCSSARQHEGPGVFLRGLPARFIVPSLTAYTNPTSSHAPQLAASLAGRDRSARASIGIRIIPAL